MNGPCVFLVDDQPATLQALARLLKASGCQVQAFASAHAFLDSGSEAMAGCLVLDLSMPEMSGLELQQELSRRGSDLPLIFLTGHGDIDSGVRAIKLGAFDFLTKPVDGQRLLETVQAALELNVLARASNAARHDLRLLLASLTPREREVMQLVAEGLLNKQIGKALGMAEKTVKVHRARVMQKLNVRSVSALVRLVDRADPAVRLPP